MEMSRQRLRPGMIEATTQPCAHCHGTGLIRSDDNLALSILREIEEEGTRGRSREVLVKAPVAIVNYLMNQKREHVAQIEARYGLSVRIEADPHLVSPDFAIEKFKTATRAVPKVEAPVVSGDISIMDAIDDAEIEDAEVVSEESAAEEKPAEDTVEEKPKKRRRRRRRRHGNGDGEDSADGESKPESDSASEASEDGEITEGGSETPTEESSDGEEKPKKRSRSRRSRSRGNKSEAAPQEVTAEDNASEVPAPDSDEAPVEARDSPASGSETEIPAAAEETETVAVAESTPQSEDVAVDAGPGTNEIQAEPPVEDVEVEADVVAEVVVAEPEPAAPPKPKRRGWWSRG